MTSLPDYVEFRKFPGIPLKDIFSAAGDDLLDMLDRLLDCNPSGRVNATQVQYNSLRYQCTPNLIIFPKKKFSLFQIDHIAIFHLKKIL